MDLDVLQILQSASWPSFLTDETGKLLHANQAATLWFGSKIADNPPLDSLWIARAEDSKQFLQNWERIAPPTTTIQFSGRDDALQSYSTRICSIHQNGVRWYLFQLFNLEAPSLPKLPEKKPPAEAAPETPAPATPSPTASPPLPQQQPVSQSPEYLEVRERLDEATKLSREVAIDLNNTLTSILGHTSLVLSQLDRKAPQKGALEAVEDAAEKAAEIITRLVEFSREKETPTKSATPSKVNALLRQAVDQVKKNNSGKIDFTLQLDESPYFVDLDDAKMLQAFVKVLENAREGFDSYGSVQVYTRNEDYSKPHVDERTSLEPGSYVCVEIVDEGPGMSPEVMNRMFEPFFTTKAGHRGLGLSWVYGILTNVGGSVAVTSAPSQGASFRLYLPAGVEQVEEDSPEESAKQHILMIDDEPLVLQTGTAILSSAGFEVSTATSLQEAMEATDNQPDTFDLVITDLVVPNAEGQDLIDKLQQSAPNTRILRVSGFLSAAEKKHKNTLQKPFTSRHLLECVKRALDGTDGS